MNKAILTEDYCTECDEEVHQVFGEKAFLAHQVGRVRCPTCGSIVLPCNECEDNLACDNCPWASASIEKSMSDEAYIRYIRTEEPDLYELFRSGRNGNYYRDIIEKVEKELKEKKAKAEKDAEVIPCA